MKKITRKLLSLFLVFNLALIGNVLVSCSKDSTDNSEQAIEEQEEEEETVQEPEEEEDNMENGNEGGEETESCETGKVYVEKEGLLRVDLENTSTDANGWETANTLTGFEGDGYLIWMGEDSFKTPGTGILTYTIQINTPGTYRFEWSSRIGTGSSNTEHNDSWLRIKADDFYGEKEGAGTRVYPVGSGKTPNPNGDSSNGWLKVYMNSVGSWVYSSRTSDNDKHNIFAVFNSSGNYDVEISGRSRFHAIDQFILYRTDKNDNQAESSALSDITCK